MKPTVNMPAESIPVGAWVIRPLFGAVVAVIPPDAVGTGHCWTREGNKTLPSATTPFIVVQELDGASISFGCNAWTLLATPQQAAAPKSLGVVLGRLIRVYRTHPSGDVPEEYQTDWAFRLPQNMDRLNALWLALKCEHILARASAALPIQRPSFTLFLRRYSIEANLLAGLYVHLLGHLRHETSSRGACFESTLISELLHDIRRWQGDGCRGALKDKPACRKTAKLTHAISPGRVRISHHISHRRARDRWLMTLEMIAEDRPDEAICAYLFDIDNYRYRWGTHSSGRLQDLIDFLRRYTANRDAPKGSPLRVARGNAMELLRNFSASSSFAMVPHMRRLELAELRIDLMDGKVLASGFEHYRHTQLARIAAKMYQRSIANLLKPSVSSATLTIRLMDRGIQLGIDVIRDNALPLHSTLNYRQS